MAISPESQYVIDGSVECLHMTVDSAISIYMSKYDMDRKIDIFDANHNDSSLQGLVALGESVQDDMDYWLKSEASDKEKEIAYKTLLYGSSSQIRDAAKIITDELVDGYMITNGYTKAMRYRWTNEENKIFIPTKEDLLVPANIASAMSNKLYSWFTRMNERVNEAVKHDKYSINELNKYFIESQRNKNYTLIEKDKNFVNKNTIYNAKKALKKGIKKFTNLFGEDKIKSFISGSEFLIEGRLYNYAISPKRSLSLVEQTYNPLRGHIPYNLSILDKKTNIIIADGCVVTNEKTPIIDQIIGIILYIKHDEETLVDTANWFNFRNDVVLEKEDKILKKSKGESLVNNIFEKTPEESFEEKIREELFNNVYKNINPYVKKFLGVENCLYEQLKNSRENPILLN